MSGNKRKDLGLGLREIGVKIVLLAITVGIGLWAGRSSYDSFYIAAFIQACNNMYDASAYFSGFTKSITIFQIISFFGSLICLIVSIMHMSDNTLFNMTWCMWSVGTILSLPILFLLIEVYSMIREERY